MESQRGTWIPECSRLDARLSGIFYRHMQPSFNGHDCHKKYGNAWKERSKTIRYSTYDERRSLIVAHPRVKQVNQPVCDIYRLANESCAQVGESQSSQKNKGRCSQRRVSQDCCQNQTICHHCRRRPNGDDNRCGQNYHVKGWTMTWCYDFKVERMRRRRRCPVIKHDGLLLLAKESLIVNFSN